LGAPLGLRNLDEMEECENGLLKRHQLATPLKHMACVEHMLPIPRLLSNLSLAIHKMDRAATNTPL